MNLDELLKSIPRPHGVEFLDGQGMVMTQPTPGGHRMKWVAYLWHMTPATGPDGEGAQMFVHRIDLPTGPFTEMTPDRIAQLRVIITAAIDEFHVALEEGTATEIQDGEILP